MINNETIPALNPSNAYSLVEAARSSLDVGALGLGVSGNIPTVASLYTFITIEMFCAFFNLVVILNESTKLYTDKSGNTMGRSIYLSFRLLSVVSSLIGLTLMSIDLHSNNISGNKIVIGTILVALGLFISHAMNVSRKAWLRLPAAS